MVQNLASISYMQVNTATAQYSQKSQQTGIIKKKLM